MGRLRPFGCAIILTGVMIMAILCGCGRQKYTVYFDHGGSVSRQSSYAAGTQVEVGYMIATDTDYQFRSDDVEFEQDYDPSRGVVFRFVMPEHDVKIEVSSRNSMTYDPDANAYGGQISGNAAAGVPTGDNWICPECGAENDGRFCHECGTRRPE